jgi:murein DD-endopeptidase MepM/ murein hydrolase activator NlpD
MMFSPRLNSALVALFLGACAAPNPSRVAVTIMGTKAHGDTTTIAARSGDTVYSLSQYLGVDTRALIDKNNLVPPYTLNSGQILRVPAPEMVTARKGDTLFSIARSYGADQTELAKLNNLNAPYQLYEGQQIKLPSTSASEITAVTESAPYVDNALVTSEPLSGPIETTQTADGNKTHRSAAGVITEQDLTPPPGATQGDQKLGEKVASLPPPVAPVPTPPTPSPFSKPSSPPTKPKQYLGTGVPQFSWPVNGSTLSKFGPKAGGRHNDGINIGAPLGTPVRASAAGEVVYTGNNVAGFGNLVLIRHSGGYATAYAHVQNPSVARGDHVTAGQAIAQIGKTGNVSTPQLHFEVRKGTQAVNPDPYLP